MLLYEQQTFLPEEYIRKSIQNFLEEDIPSVDITSKPIIESNSWVEAFLQAEENLTFVGFSIIPVFFPVGSDVTLHFHDGEKVRKGEIIANIKAPAYIILTRERIMLNLIQRLCGIAGMASKYSEIAKPYGVKILDTRKTTPGLRLFEKYAVRAGGAYNHRMDLSSGILIKDNHIKAAGSITNAVSKIKKMNYNLPIEVEIENFDELKEALLSGVNALLLDNMKPETLIEAVKIIRETDGGNEIMIEASGGINFSNLEEYVKTGVDAISTGALTHSVKNANIHLEFV